MVIIKVKLNAVKKCALCEKTIKANENALAYGIPAINEWSGKKAFIISFYMHESCYNLEIQKVKVRR